MTQPQATPDLSLYEEQEQRIATLAEKNAHLAVQNVGLQGALDQARLDVAELQTVLAGTRMLLENLTAKHAEQMERAERAEATVEKLTETLEFYADPETYVAIGFFPDSPCGEFITDFEELPEEFIERPGKRAREALKSC